MSLRLRLLLTLVPLFIVGLLVANVTTYAALQSFLTTRLDQQVRDAHAPIERSLQGSSNPDPSGFGGTGGPPGGAPGSTFPLGTYGELRSPSGSVLKSQSFGYSTSSATHPILPASLHPGTSANPTLLTVDGVGGISKYRVFVDRTTDGNIIIAAIPLSDLDATLNQLLLLELAVSGTVTLLLTLATLILVRRSLRPLDAMGQQAQSIVASALGQRVEPANERTEVGRLGLALNMMLGRLEDAFEARAASQERLKQFVSDASHELRTPLTSMRGYAELLRSGDGLSKEDATTAARRIEDEARRLGVLVDDLLLLARMDQGRSLQSKRVDLEALVSDACADARIADPGRTLTARVMAPLVVDGDDMRLRQVLSNLIRNALVHTPAGTPVEVTLRPEQGRAVIEIVDHGPGIPEAEAVLVFERFHRSDPERSRDRGGSGLGLSIAAAVVTAHDGAISVLETPGGGATFRIELPLERPTATNPDAAV